MSKANPHPTEVVPIDTIRPDPNNARRHPERNLAALAASLARFGQQRPVLVDEEGVIVAGNGLWSAMRAAGLKEIAVTRTALTGADRVAYAIADNRTAELSEWDEEILAQQLGVLGDEFKSEMLFDVELALAAASAGERENKPFDPTDLPDLGPGGNTSLSYVLMLPFKDSGRLNKAMSLLLDDLRQLPEGARYATVDGEKLIAKLEPA